MLLRLHSEPDVAHWHSVCTGVQTYCTSADISDADDTTPGDMLAAHAVALDLRAPARGLADGSSVGFISPSASGLCVQDSRYSVFKVRPEGPKTTNRCY